MEFHDHKNPIFGVRTPWTGVLPNSPRKLLEKNPFRVVETPIYRYSPNSNSAMNHRCSMLGLTPLGVLEISIMHFLFYFHEEIFRINLEISYILQYLPFHATISIFSDYFQRKIRNFISSKKRKVLIQNSTKLEVSFNVLIKPWIFFLMRNFSLKNDTFRNFLCIFVAWCVVLKIFRDELEIRKNYFCYILISLKSLH